MSKHPVDQMYDQTRAAWEEYIDMSTPWPSDPVKRRVLVARRTRVMEARVRILEGFPPDARTKRELRTLRAIVTQDKVA